MSLTIQSIREMRAEFNARLGAQTLEAVAKRLHTEYPDATHLVLDRNSRDSDNCVYRADYLYRVNADGDFDAPLDVEIDLIITPGDDHWPATSTANLVSEITSAQWDALQEMHPELFGPDVFCDGSLNLILNRKA